MMQTLPAELRRFISESNDPVPLQDAESQRLYYLISADQYEKVKRFMEAEEIDSSFFEFDDEDFDSGSARHN